MRKNAKEITKYILRHTGLWRHQGLLRALAGGLSVFQKNKNYIKYIKQKKQFEDLGGVITNKFIILRDYDDQAGISDRAYFHQDLLVASFIYKNNPKRHIDIGSRIDGFVAHVASFREIEIMDVRPLSDLGHKNIKFVQADLMDSGNAHIGITDSISCLHAIEHFGLGRYGDPIDPFGHIKGYRNMVRMLQPGGVFFISFPIGRKNEVHFNAHRVFHPKDILSWTDSNTLQLQRFDYVDDAGKMHCDVDIETARIDVIYGCGIYTFKKLA